MNSTQYTYLLNNPEDIEEDNIADLEEILVEFPYFQSARALVLKGLYDNKSPEYNYALKTTAAYTTDRSVLFDFITSDGFIIKKINEVNESKLSQNLEVTEETAEETIIPAEENTVEPIQLAKEEYELKNDSAEVESNPIPQEQIEEQQEVLETPETLEHNKNTYFSTPASNYISSADENTELLGKNEEENSQEIKVSNREPKKTNAKPPLESIFAWTFEPITEQASETHSDAVNDNTTEQKKEAIERLEIDKPLKFTKNEKHSFGEWMQVSKNNSQEKEEKMESFLENVKKRKTEIIDRFIETNPKITRGGDVSIGTSTYTPKEIESETPATETLAEVYLKQKKYDKAILAYQILILKNPQKSSYFAARISDIKKIIQNNSNK